MHIYYTLYTLVIVIISKMKMQNNYLQVKYVYLEHINQHSEYCNLQIRPEANYDAASAKV